MKIDFLRHKFFVIIPCAKQQCSVTKKQETVMYTYFPVSLSPIKF